MKLMEHTESSAKRKSHSSECLHKEIERSYTISLAAHLEALDQKEVNIPKRSRQPEIIKLRDEINQVEIKETIQMINTTRFWFFGNINKKDKL